VDRQRTQCSNLVAEIYLGRLRENIKLVLEHVPVGVQVMGVVKADGYGHGAAQIARVLTECGISYLAVSDVDEALALRAAGLKSPILLLADTSFERLEDVVSYELTAAVSDLGFAEVLSHAAGHLGRRARVHLNVDTGMGRFGMEPGRVLDALKKLQELPNIIVEGIFSHLSTTYRDDPESDRYNAQQVKIFTNLLTDVDKAGWLPKMVHIGNSPAFLAFPQLVASGYYNTLRIGTLFFGYEERLCDWDCDPVPIAEVGTKILTLRDLPAGRSISYDQMFHTQRDSRIAVLPIGYSHGLHRDLSNCGEVLVNGKRAPIVGKICLAQTMIDVTGIEGIKSGTQVTLVGRDLSACEEGRKIDRETWELLLPLLYRSEHRYIL